MRTAAAASAADFTILRCVTRGVHAVAARTRRTFSRHTHDEFGIGVIHFGAHRSHSGIGQVEATTGDAITVNPGEVHDGAPVDETGRAWTILYFHPSVVDAAAREVWEGRKGQFEFARPVIRDRRVVDLARRLFAAETRAEEAMRCEELLLALAARTGGIRPDTAEPPPPVAAAKARIDDDPAGTVTLAELAEGSGISRFQLLRGFSRATGLTPHAYLVQRRSALARRLIGSGMPLASAASAAGFSDQSHMTRVFVRKYGIAPGAYARALRDGA